MSGTAFKRLVEKRRQTLRVDSYSEANVVTQRVWCFPQKFFMAMFLWCYDCCVEQIGIFLQP